MSDSILGLIAGNGKFPILFAYHARRKGYRVITFAITGEASWLLRFFVDEIRYFSVGDLHKSFTFLKERGVKQAVMAGQVRQKNLFDQRVKFDEAAQAMFTALENRKADTIFATLGTKLLEYGITLLDSTFLIKDHLALKGTLTKRGPTVRELEDIQFGKDLAKTMGGLDVGQTVVVKGKAIVAVEAMEGTDKTILRGGLIAHNGAVVVKVSKPKQDLRFDVPVIGPRTIKNMIKSKCSCLAIEAQKTIIIDREKVVKMANKASISIVSSV